MRLLVTTPTAVIVDAADAAYVQAEDDSGVFGILPGHADFLSVLAPSVMTWRDGAGTERYVAVRGGVLAVRGGQSVEVASREAVPGDDLHALQRMVGARLRQGAEEEAHARSRTAQLQLAAFRQIYHYLQDGRGERDGPRSMHLGAESDGT